MAPERGANETDGERLRQAVARLQPSGRRGADRSAAERAVWEAVAAEFRAGQAAALAAMLARAGQAVEAARANEGAAHEVAVETGRYDEYEWERDERNHAEGVAAGIERAISAVAGAEGSGG